MNDKPNWVLALYHERELRIREFEYRKQLLADYRALERENALLKSRLRAVEICDDVAETEFQVVAQMAE
jgi:hypothetical protein